MIGNILDWLTDPDHWSGPDGIPTRILEHLQYSVIALVIAVLIGLPIGLLIGHTGKGTAVVAAIAKSCDSGA